jgi:signal peptidase I
MMQFWKDRQARQGAKELVAAARKLVRMNRDIMEPQQVEEIDGACTKLDRAIKSKDMPTIAVSSDTLEILLGKAFPKGKNSWLIENVEVLVVAIIVAMAVRTFFIQPFKIPTGSMQPTLYGIFPPEQSAPIPYADDSMPSIIEMIWGTITKGRIYTSKGFRDRGDHIFVDRFTYHFRKPKHGEVVVFLTDHIDAMPEASRGKFYIKRLIALGGETVDVTPPYVNVNGKRLESPAFLRIYSMQNGYNGYTLPPPESYFTSPALFINTREPKYTVPAKHFFVMGDNTKNSWDGRYWGPVPSGDLVGKAIFVYWPFMRFGLID